MVLNTKIKNFTIYGLGQFINLLSPLVVVPHLVKVCGEDGLGKIGIAFSIALILNCIIDYSSYLNGTKRISIHRNDKEFLKDEISRIYSYKFVLLFIVFALLIISVCLPFVHNKLLYVLTFSIVIAHTFNPNWILQGIENFKAISILNIVSKVLYIALVFSFVRESNDYILANFFLGMSGVLVYAIAFVFLKRKFNFNFNKTAVREGLQVLKTDFNVCLSEFCLSVYQFFPIILVGGLLGNTSAGVFKIIEQIYGVFRTFITMFFNFSFPAICLEMESNLKQGVQAWKKHHLINLLMVLLGCSIVFFGSEFILSYFGIEKNELPNALKLLDIAIFIPIILVFSQALRQLMLVCGLIKKYTKIVYIITVLNVVLLTIMIFFLQLKGAFITTLIIEFILCLLYIIMLTKKEKIVL